jgi:hypothetical protein
LAESIIFLEGSSLDIEVPEKADVLITETICNVAFDEGIITWVADAKKRFLKPEAALVPQRLDAMASLISAPRDYATVERWSQPLLTLDVAPLSRIVRNNALPADLSPAAIVTPPAVVFGTDFSSEPKLLSGSVDVEALKDAVVHGGFGSDRASRRASRSRMSPRIRSEVGNKGSCPSTKPSRFIPGMSFDSRFRHQVPGLSGRGRLGLARFKAPGTVKSDIRRVTRL